MQINKLTSNANKNVSRTGNNNSGGNTDSKLLNFCFIAIMPSA